MIENFNQFDDIIIHSDGKLYIGFGLSVYDNIEYFYIYTNHKEYRLSLYDAQYLKLNGSESFDLSVEKLEEIYNIISFKWNSIKSNAEEIYHECWYFANTSKKDIILPDTIPDYRKIIQRS